MKVHANALAAKVAARNEVNAFANASFQTASDALKPFVNQKVCKVDGSLLEKVKRALPVLDGGHFPQTWYSTGHGYNLVLNVKTCVSAKGKTSDYQLAHYAESTVYLGHLDNGVLTGLYDAPRYQTDYTEDFVRAARLEVEQADKAKREAESKIHYFGMYD